MTSSTTPTSTPTPAPKRRMVFFGDSITAGDGDRLAFGWPARLCVASQLTNRPIHCYNLGVGGDRIAHIHARWQREADARLAGKTGGSLIFLMGLNDAIKAAAIDDRIDFDADKTYHMIVEILEAAKTMCPSLIIEPTPVHPQLSRRDGAEGAKINQLLMGICETIQSAASTAQIPAIALTQKFIDSAEFNTALLEGDGLHPSENGQDFIAEFLAADPLWKDFIS